MVENVILRRKTMQGRISINGINPVSLGEVISVEILQI